MAKLDHALPVGIANDPRWIAAQRVANSTCFQRCSRLREFLLYVTEHQLGGHTEEITEQHVGHRVYERGELYSPADDNIVRVSARQLRAKLREFYETEGREEPWIIEIPKGGYIPRFQKRETVEPPVFEEGAIESKIESRRPRLGLGYRLLAGLVLLAAATAIWYIPHKLQPPDGRIPEPNLITLLFRGSAEPTQVILSDPVLGLMQGALGRRITIDEYGSQNYRQLPPGWRGNQQAERIWQALTTRQLANLGDIGAATRIRDVLEQPGHAPAVTTHSAQNMQARDFRSGNFILLGDWYSDPWTQLFGEDQFNFRFERNFPNTLPVIRNIHPNAGESHVYADGTTDSRGYARIALVPNLTHTGRVLLIAGTSMESTEAAAGFCLDSGSSQKLLSTLGVGAREKLPSFEALLRTSTAGGMGINAELVSVRILSHAP